MRLNIIVALLGCFCLVQLVQASSFRQTFSTISFVALAFLPTVSPPDTFLVGHNDAFFGRKGTCAVIRNDTFRYLKPTATIKLATTTTKEFLETVEVRRNCLPLAPVLLPPEVTSTTHKVQDYGSSLFGQAHVTISAPRPYNVSLIYATGLLLNTTAPVNLSYPNDAEIYLLSIYGTTREYSFRSSGKLSRIGEVAISVISRIFAYIDAAQAATALSIRSSTSVTINAILSLDKYVHTSLTTLWKSKPLRYTVSAFLVTGAEAVGLAWVFQGNSYGREGSWLRTSTNVFQTSIYLVYLSVTTIIILPIEMFRENGLVRRIIGLLIAIINLAYSLLCQVPAWAWLSLFLACCVGVDVVRVAPSFTQMKSGIIITAKLGSLSAAAMAAVYFLWSYPSLVRECLHRIFVVSKKCCFLCGRTIDCARKFYASAMSSACEDHLDSASFNPPSASFDVCDNQNERPLPSGRPLNDYQTWDRPNRPEQIVYAPMPYREFLPLRPNPSYAARRPLTFANIPRLPPHLQMIPPWNRRQYRKQFFVPVSPNVTPKLPPIQDPPAPDSDPNIPQEVAPNAEVSTTLCLPNSDVDNFPQPVVPDSTTSLLTDSAASDPILDCILTFASTSIQDAPTPLQASNLIVSPLTITTTTTTITQLMDFKHTGSAKNLLERFEYEPTSPAVVLASPDTSSDVVDYMAVDQDAIAADKEPMVICEPNGLARNVTPSSAHLPQSISTHSPFSSAPHLPPWGNTLQQAPFTSSTAGGLPLTMDSVPGPTLTSLPGASSFAPQPPPSASGFMTTGAQSQPASFLASAPSIPSNSTSGHFQASSTAPWSSASMPALGHWQNGNAPLLPSSNALQPNVGPFEVVLCNLPIGTTANSIIPLVKEVSKNPFPFVIKCVCNEGRQVHVVVANETIASFVHGNFDKITYSDAARRLHIATGVSDTEASKLPAIQAFWKGAPAPGSMSHLYHGAQIGVIPTNAPSAHVEVGAPDLNVKKDRTQPSSQTFTGNAGALGPADSALRPPFSYVPSPLASSPAPLPVSGTTWQPPPQTSSWQQSSFSQSVPVVAPQASSWQPSPFSQSAPAVVPQPRSFRSATSDDIDMEDIAPKSSNVFSNPITTGQTLNLPVGGGRPPTKSSPLNPSASGQPQAQSFTGGARAPGVPQPAVGQANTQNQLPAQTTPATLGSTWVIPMLGVSGGFCKPLPASTPLRKPTSNGVSPNSSKAVSKPAKISNPPTNSPAPSQSSTSTPAPSANVSTTAVADPPQKHIVIVRGLMAKQTKVNHLDWCNANIGIIPVDVKMMPEMMGGETVEFTFADEQHAKSLFAFAKDKGNGISLRILHQNEIQKKVSQPAALPPPVAKATPKNITEKPTILAEPIRAIDNAPTFKTEGTSRYSQVAVSAFDPDSDEDDALAWAAEMTPGKRVAACHLEESDDGRVAVFSFTTQVHADQFKMAVNAQPGPFPKPRAIARESTSAQSAAAPSTPSTPLSGPKPAIVEKLRTKAHVVEISNMDDNDEEKQKRHLVDAIARLNTEHAMPYLAGRSGENGTVVMRLEFDSEVIAKAIVEHLEGHFFDGANWGADLLKQRPVFRKLRAPRKVPKKA